MIKINNCTEHIHLLDIRVTAYRITVKAHIELFLHVAIVGRGISPVLSLELKLIRNLF